MNELISVIIPVYNVEKYIEKCLNSVTAQTYENLEIVIVNDGSTDSSIVYCEKCANDDNRIKILNKENGGLSDARNAGIDICTGNYICFVDSDDYLEKEAIERLLEKILKYNADIAIGNINKVYENGEIVEMDKLEMELLTDKKKIYSNASKYVTAWGKLYRRELFSVLRYPKDKLHEDAYIVCDLLKNANKVVQVDYYGYNYLQREGSIMNSKFTVKRLDAVEARIKRVDFYLCEGMYHEAQKNLFNSAQILYQGYKYLTTDVRENELRLNELYSQIENRHNMIGRKPGKFRYKIATKVFIKNQYLFGVLFDKRG